MPDHHQLAQALSSTAAAPQPMVADLVTRLTALHAAHTLAASLVRAATRATMTVAEAITTRIHQQAQATLQAEAVRPPETPAPLVLLPVTVPARRPITPKHPPPTRHAAPGTLRAPAAAPVVGTTRRARCRGCL